MRTRSLGAVALLCLLLTGIEPAFAAAGHSGEPLGTIPDLRNGFGDVDIAEVSTTPNGKVGRPGCGAEGAAAYKMTVTEIAKLDLVVDEIDANGLCAVGLYRQRVAGEQLTDLYDADERAGFAFFERSCDGSCEITQRLGRNTHYLVVWPRGAGAVSQRVSIAGTLRGLTTIDAQLTGTRIGGCRRIDRGTSSTLSIAVSPPPADPFAVVHVERTLRHTGASSDLGDLSLAPDGTASIELPAGKRGYHDLVITFEGSPTHERRRVRRCLIARGGTRAEIEPRRWQFTYDDYAVYRHGDQVVIRIEIRPGTLAHGRVDVRIERNIGNHRYRPFAVRKGIEVDGGLAILRMRATYRSNGLPFYRLRAEWPGSNVYRPDKSPWICIQFNR